MARMERGRENNRRGPPNLFWCQRMGKGCFPNKKSSFIYRGAPRLRAWRRGKCIFRPPLASTLMCIEAFCSDLGQNQFIRLP